MRILVLGGTSFIGLPATPLRTTAADVLAWDRARGEPPLGRGFTPAQEQTILAEHASAAR